MIILLSPDKESICIILSMIICDSSRRSIYPNFQAARTLGTISLVHVKIQSYPGIYFHDGSAVPSIAYQAIEATGNLRSCRGGFAAQGLSRIFAVGERGVFS